jgi:hypothetical protein
LLSHPHLLGSDADKMNESRARSADHLKQKSREQRQRITSASENPHVGPRIEIMFNRQQQKVFVSESVPELGAIGVLFPADIAEQFAICGMERDEITPAAMVWAEDELLLRQLRESALDVARAKPRAIPPDGDNFVIAKLRNSFNGVLKARREIRSGLPVNAPPGTKRPWRRCEKMNIDLRRNLRGKIGNA